MKFWEDLGRYGDSVAAVSDDGTRTSYRELERRVAELADAIASACPKALLLLLTDNSTGSLVRYLAALRAGAATILFPHGGDISRASGILAAFSPDLVLAPASETSVPDGYAEAQLPADGGRAFRSRRSGGVAPHGDLALLLTTSGSTGSPKLVRLSHANLCANAQSIVGYLGIGPGERAPTVLPMSYSYGLSVVNTHLASGATLLLTERTIMERGFWDFLKAGGFTSFSGVPYVYEVLQRLRFDPAACPSLRTLTQAGGHLDSSRKRWIHERAVKAGARMFVMYGQTEATARISYVPPERLAEKYDSIGIPIPGGRLEADGSGELVYRGPNVMMGYAESRADTASGDELGGVLHTGDLGHSDADGYFYVTGRLRRMVKMFGSRVSLDHLEASLRQSCGGRALAVVGRDDLLVVVHEGGGDDTQARKLLHEQMGLPVGSWRIDSVPSLPRKDNGKVDYVELARTAL